MLVGLAPRPLWACGICAAYCGLAALASNTSAARDAGPVPAGSGQIAVQVGELSIDLFTYRPADYRDGPLIVVCHGMQRNADEYRDHARGLAERVKGVVVAPRFDLERFPIEDYQLGGVQRGGQLRPRDEWTISLVPVIVEQVRRRESRADWPYWLIGHSAGGQFLCRLAALTDVECRGIVVANAGTHLFPTRDLPFPHGFGGLPEPLGSDDALRRYLGQPVSIYLGTADLGDRNLPKSPVAMQQGATRYERGRRCFELAAELARQRGWPFRWRLVEAPGVGHDARAMFDHDQALQALAP